MTSTGDIAAKMVAALNASIPDLDTSPGTPTRKILDAVSEAIAESYSDSHLINYQYDIDSKVGGDLDDFCSLFGITRLPASRAQGVVTFTRPSDAFSSGSALVIPPGTQVIALTNPPVIVQTTVSTVLNPGQLTGDIPVQAVSPGASGNVAAGLLITMGTGLSGVTSVINAAPMTGGSNQESDADLRTRFKATVFRSLAGTQSMYQAIALATPQDATTPGVNAVSQVNVIGSSKRYREQIQIASGSATSTVQNAAYIFSDNMYCGRDIDAGSMLTPGTDFTFTPTNSTVGANSTAVITSTSANMPDGLYDLDIEYVPQASRNDPGNTRFALGGINNRVDIWINGQIGTTAVQSVIFSNSRVFNTTLNSPYQASQFATSNPSSPTPPIGYFFIPLAFGPILTLPTTLIIGGTTYTQGTDYWAAWRNDAFGRSPRSLQGILWQTTRVPANGAAFSITYNYNTVARNAQENVDQWRLVGTDARVHCGIPMPIRFYFAIVYDRQYDPSSVNTNISTALATLCGGVGFNNQLQVSDVIQAVHNVPGVDNVRFQTSGDNATNYAMALMSAWATTPTQISLYANGGRVIDASFADNQYPVFYDVQISQRANNSFRTGA